jgi:hypothetical protein
MMGDLFMAKRLPFCSFLLVFGHYHLLVAKSGNYLYLLQEHPVSKQQNSIS